VFLRDVIQVKPRPTRLDAGHQRLDVAHERRRLDAGIEERRQHQRAGEAQVRGRLGKCHGLVERAHAGADHEAVHRHARVLDGAHDGEALLQSKRVGLAGGAEQVDGIAACFEKVAKMRQEPRDVGTVVGMHGRRGGRDDAPEAGLAQARCS
jgi:hypothetical protein